MKPIEFIKIIPQEEEVMSLKIIRVSDAGDDQSERLVMKVTDECNLKDFMVMDCTYENGVLDPRYSDSRCILS